MKPNKTIIIFSFVLAIFSLPLFCQAQKDTSLINKIERAVARIEKDTTLDCFYTGFLGQKGNHGFLAYYLKSDSIYKVVMLNADPSGTQMKTYYYINSTPILAIMKHNNFQMSHDINQYSVSILSFDKKVSDSGYITDSQTMYYVDQGRAFYSNTISRDHNNLKKAHSNDEALMLVFEAQNLSSSFSRESKYFKKMRGG